MKALQSAFGMRFDLEAEETITWQQNQLSLNGLKWQILCEKEGCTANRTLDRGLSSNIELARSISFSHLALDSFMVFPAS